MSFASLDAQKVQMQTIFEDDISIRAIEIYNNKVWYAGTKSKFGYVDLITLDKQQITLSEQPLQFRTLGQDKDFFYTINIESPAQFFRIKKSDLSYEILYVDKDKNAFYDALHFYTLDKAITFSDPEEDNNLKLRHYKNGNWSKINFENKPTTQLAKGEAAFAASNSNISSKGNWIWVATGGKEANVYKICKRNFNKIYKYKTPFIQGEATQGIYSIDFYNAKKGIAVGGDYTKPNQNINNIATTIDGGKTWQIQASGLNAGYSTFVGYAPDADGKIIASVGDYHISLSVDAGKTWQKVSDEKGFFTAKWLDKNILVLAGKNKIAKMKFIY